MVQPISAAFEMVAAMTVHSIHYLQAELKCVNGVDIVDPFCDFDILQISLPVILCTTSYSEFSG